MAEKQVTLKGHWKHRDTWLAIWHKLVIQARTLDEITLHVNGEKVTLPAEFHDTEIHAILRPRDLKLDKGGAISRIVIPLDSRTMFTAQVRGYSLSDRDSLRIIILRFPADGVERSAAIRSGPYRGDAKELKFVKWA